MIRIAFVVCLAGSALTAFGCDCVPVSVMEAKKLAEVVFRGTITDISGGKVTFRVDRVWKGDIGKTFEMVDFPEGAACIGFLPKLLRVGNDVLVFAARLHRYANDNEYFTSICTRTSLSAEAASTFDKLGRGKPPRR